MPVVPHLKMSATVWVLTVLLLGVVGCGEGPTALVSGQVPNIGALVYAAPEIIHNSDMAWVGSDGRIAFRSWNGEVSFLKLLDIRTGEARILDGPTSSLGGPGSTLFRQVIAGKGGDWIYYGTTVGFSSVIRRVASNGGDPVTLDTNGGHGGVALAPGDDRLAYSRDTSVVLLNLETMLTTEISEVDEPTSFSPDGSELLVWNHSDQGRAQLARAQLALGTTEPLDLGSPSAEIFAASWRESGILVLAQDDAGLAVLEFHFGFGPATRFPLDFADARVVIRGGALAPRGDAFAIWTQGCAGAGPFGGCSLSRFTVHVGTASEGAVVGIGSEDSNEAPALLFSRDGSRLYYSLGGKLYVAQVTRASAGQ